METVPEDISGLPKFSFYTMEFKNEEGVSFLPPTKWNTIYETLIKEDVSPTIKYKQISYKQKPQRQSERSFVQIAKPIWKDNQSRRRRSEESLVYGKYSKKRNRLEMFSGNTKITVSKPNVRMISLKHMRKSSLNNIYFAPELGRKASFNLGSKQNNKLKLDIAPLDDEIVRKINVVIQGKPKEEHRNAQTLRKLLKRKTEILKIGQMFGRGTKILQTIIGKTVVEDSSETPLTCNQECRSEYQVFQYPNPGTNKLSLHRKIFTHSVQNKGSPHQDFVSLNKRYPLLRKILTCNKIVELLPTTLGKSVSLTPIAQSHSSNQSINRTLKKSVHQQLKQVDKALRHSKTKSIQLAQDRQSPNMFCKPSFRITARMSTLKCASQHYGQEKSQVSPINKLKTKQL